jgi:hypothetical protein
MNLSFLVLIKWDKKSARKSSTQTDETPEDKIDKKERKEKESSCCVIC